MLTDDGKEFLLIIENNWNLEITILNKNVPHLRRKMMNDAEQLSEQLLHSIRSKMSYGHTLRLARKLAQMKYSQVIDQLLTEYQKSGEDASIKIGIINVLGLFPRSDVKLLLKEELLKAPNPSIRAAAAVSLGKTHDEENFHYLLEALSREDHSSVKRNIISALGNFSFPEVKEIMKQMLLDESDPGIRAITLQNIARRGWKEFLPLLKKLETTETHPNVKKYLQHAIKMLK